ncbi:MAG: response regulator [Elusimicrobia bacterium]|nr:response regulator [Elusimicrobiota bacterium]
MAKILIADDDEEQRLWFRQILASYDCQVFEAASGWDAVELAILEKPDLIFLDYRMPQVNGWDAIRVLRMKEELRSIPVVMITAKHFDSSSQDTIRSEIDGFIEKPLSKDKILETIKEACGGLNPKDL